MIDFKAKKRDCTSCGEIKHFNEFNWDNRRGIPRAECKKCASIRMAKKYNPQKAREYYRKVKEKRRNENLC
jgi:hypothetical protein